MEYKKNGWIEDLGYFALGAGIGAALGILYAPKAGRVTREDVTDWLNEKRRAGRRQARVLQDAIERGRRNVMHRTHRAAGH